MYSKSNINSKRRKPKNSRAEQGKKMLRCRTFLTFALVQVLLLVATVHGAVEEGSEWKGFTTTSGCEVACSTALDPEKESIPTGICDSATYSDCQCVYEDPYCSSECDSFMGEWMTLCGGGSGGEAPAGDGEDQYR